MWLVVLAISLALTGLCIYCAIKSHDYDFWGFMITVSIAFIIGIIILPIHNNVDKILESKYIDSKIEMYQEENEKIESDIEIMVSQYMKHEAKVFDLSEVNSPTTLVQMYPELKSNELIIRQMDIFNENNQKIKKLKLKKIDCEKAKFWIYFGGN